jgi:chemotaxis protein CheD
MTNVTALKRVSVQIGEVKVGGADTVLFTIGLGSCVAIALYDAETRIGGVAHAMLPFPTTQKQATFTGRFVSTAVPQLLTSMAAEGARLETIRARIAGGASMFEKILTDYGRKLGPRNVEAARQVLASAGVPLDAEDVGGSHGRSVFLTIADGSVVVTSVHHDDVIL